jgi:glycosyltransferase involved in cell wall biosynthesis
VPLISSDAGGLPEININGETGFMSAVGDIASMSRNAIRLLTDENMLQAFKKNAAVNAEKFDIHQIVPKYERLYNRFLGTPAEKKYVNV